MQLCCLMPCPCKDALLLVLVWLALLGARLSLFARYVWEADGSINLSAIFFCIEHAISTAVLVVASFWQVRTSHAMMLIVNAWSAWFVEGDASCLEAKRDWRGISSLFRKTSRSFERCLTALGSTMVMLIFAQLYDLQQDRGMDLVASSMFVAYLIPGQRSGCKEESNS